MWLGPNALTFVTYWKLSRDQEILLGLRNAKNIWTTNNNMQKEIGFQKKVWNYMKEKKKSQISEQIICLFAFSCSSPGFKGTGLMLCAYIPLLQSAGLSLTVPYKFVRVFIRFWLKDFWRSLCILWHPRGFLGIRWKPGLSIWRCCSSLLALIQQHCLSWQFNSKNYATITSDYVYIV